MNERAIRSFLKTLLLIAWALWFGGVMGLFLSVQVLFHQTERSVFLASAPKLFLAFERYQLLLAVTTVVATAVLRTMRLLVFFVIATAGAVVETTLITPRIEALRIAGETHTSQFLQLHGLSMCVYMLVAITLLAAGVAQAMISQRERANRFAAASILPAGAGHR